MAEPGTNSVGTQALGDLGVHGTAELSEGGDGVLLSDLHHDARADGHVLDHRGEFWQHSIVDLEELLSSWLVEDEHLHRADFETLLENHINNLTGKTLLNDMRLDHAASAVVEGGSGSKLVGEVQGSFSVEVSSGGRSVQSISHGISTEFGTQRAWRLSLGLGGISWSKDASELFNGVVSYEFHASYNIRLHERSEITEEWLALVLIVKFVGELGSVELAHLEVRDCETASVNGIDNFSGLSVTVRFDEGKSSSSSLLKSLTSMNIGIVDQLKLSRINADSGANKELPN